MPSIEDIKRRSMPVGKVRAIEEYLENKEGVGDSESVAWGDVTGKPSTFPPAAHTHNIADIDTLQSTLNDLESRLAALKSAGE